ncbi:MAG: NAD(P) transhydrogenase subunit alpha [Bacteroidota bacterium]
MSLTVGVPRETAPGETRIALAPDAIKRLARKGCEVVVERGAGERAYLSDAALEAASARLGSRAEALGCEVVATVAGLASEDLGAIREGAVVMGLLRPLDDPDGLRPLAEGGATVVAMEMVPRTSRAQRMDALSAMSTVAGYRAALLSALHLPQFFPLLTTAAGTVRPARVLVIGAGVAGLQALATARRLGAITAGYDVREAARDQVQSVGAEFVTLDLETGDQEDAGGYAKALAEDQQTQQVAALARVLPEYHVVITTALIPGRAAPVLITEAGLAAMRDGSVIVDLAAANGGNVTASRPDEPVVSHGVTVLGPTNLPAEMPTHASEMYGRTVAAFLLEFLSDEGVLVLDPEDEIVAGAVVARGGEIVHPRVLAALQPA